MSREMSTSHPSTDAPMMTTPRTSHSGTVYPWLLSDYHADTWVLRDPEVSPKDAVTVYWSAALPGATHLTDSGHRHLLETIRRVVILRRVGAVRGARKSTDSAQTQHACAMKLIALVRWMLARGTERFGHLTPSDFAEFCQDVRSGLHDDVTRLRALAETYRASGRTPPTHKPAHSLNVYLNRTAFLREAGLGRSRLAEVGYELSRLSLEVFELPLTSAARRAYEQGPPERKALTRGGIRNHLLSWAYLWQYRDELRDPLSFQPINGSVNALADALGRVGGRTPNIPPRVALWILDRSLRWVLHYAPDLLRLRDEVMALESEMRLKKVPTSQRTSRRTELLGHFTPAYRGPAEPWPLSPSLVRDRADGRLDLMRALNGYVAAACMIVIAAFSARRHQEITKIGRAHV